MKTFAVIFFLTAFAGAVVASFPQSSTKDKAYLGKRLFFDTILSADKTVSCATCHKPDFAFADTVALSAGVGGAKGLRNTPSAMNVRLQKRFFWDGRAESLEAQALAPISNPAEMNLPIEEAVERLRQDASYRKDFETVFYSQPTKENLAQALAAFERTLETSDSPFDEWKFSGREDAVSAAVKNGFALFTTKAKCSQCHFGADFASDEFRNIGLFNGKDLNDSGRALVTGKKEDIGKFKIGPLRNVALTAPYMHNGMFKTLKEVIQFYNDPRSIVNGIQNIDTLLRKPLHLSAQEQQDLEAFLHALTDKQFLKN